MSKDQNEIYFQFINEKICHHYTIKTYFRDSSLFNMVFSLIKRDITLTKNAISPPHHCLSIGLKYYKRNYKRTNEKEKHLRSPSCEKSPELFFFNNINIYNVSLRHPNVFQTKCYINPS